MKEVKILFIVTHTGIIDLDKTLIFQKKSYKFTKRSTTNLKKLRFFGMASNHINF